MYKRQFVGNGFQRIRRVVVDEAFLFQDVAAEVVGVLPRRAIRTRAGIAVVVDLNQLTKRIVGVASPLAVQRRTRNVPVVVVAVAAVAAGLGNRRNEIRHAARAVSARREMVFARERFAAQLDRRERRPIQLVNGRRALPDFLAARTICPVSYTHLDVYKRQVELGFLLTAVEHLPRLAVAIFVINILRAEGPVSYTHLRLIKLVPSSFVTRISSFVK